jgi:hypothetical protein
VEGGWPCRISGLPAEGCPWDTNGQAREPTAVRHTCQIISLNRAVNAVSVRKVSRVTQGLDFSREHTHSHCRLPHSLLAVISDGGLVWTPALYGLDRLEHIASNFRFEHQAITGDNLLPVSDAFLRVLLAGVSYRDTYITQATGMRLSVI